MGLLSVIGKAIKDYVSTPESFKIGEQFENYVREKLFIPRYYDLLERTHNYQTNKEDYVKSSLKPDFKFADKWTKSEFFVEVKSRSGWLSADDKLIWCNEKQLLRYKEYNREIPVYVILGIGNNPNNPEYVSLLPLSQAKYTGLFESVIRKFEIDPYNPISSKVLWNR